VIPEENLMNKSMPIFDEVNYLLANPDVAEAVRSKELRTGEEHYHLYGRLENRPLHPSQRPKSRQEKVLTGLDRKGLGLEIGPSHNPVAPKREGFNVHILDHLNASDLKEKYKEHGVKLDNIEDVDFVWNGEPLSKLIGRVACYDWIIASHVIEHVPDLVTFLQQCESLLRPNGKLSLVIPDKRYCFDYFGEVSNTGEILDAWHQQRTRPTPGQVFHMHANLGRLNNQIAWEVGKTGEFSIGDFDGAAALWRRASSSNEYIDVHCWRFVPAVFDLMLQDLRQLGLTSFSAETSFDTVGCEFCVVLVKGPPIDSVDRMHLLKKIRESQQ
jgi:predicted SAM-dependent methyltransferase